MGDWILMIHTLTIVVVKTFWLIQGHGQKIKVTRSKVKGKCYYVLMLFLMFVCLFVCLSVCLVYKSKSECFILMILIRMIDIDKTLKVVKVQGHIFKNEGQIHSTCM